MSQSMYSNRFKIRTSRNYAWLKLVSRRLVGFLQTAVVAHGCCPLNRSLRDLSVPTKKVGSPMGGLNMRLLHWWVDPVRFWTSHVNGDFLHPPTLRRYSYFRSTSTILVRLASFNHQKVYMSVWVCPWQTLTFGCLPYVVGYNHLWTHVQIGTI